MSVLRLAHHICSSWFVFYQTKNCFILSYLVQWKQWIILNQSYWDGGFFLGGGVVALLLTVYFSSRFHSELLWTWNVLGNSSVCACMCVGVCARAAGFKPFSGPFFTTVRVEPPLRSGDFSVCWCVIAWYHISVRWKTDRESITWIAIEPLNVSSQPREAKGDKGDVTNPFRTISTCLYTKLSCTRLLRCQLATVAVL